MMASLHSHVEERRKRARNRHSIQPPKPPILPMTQPPMSINTQPLLAPGVDNIPSSLQMFSSDSAETLTTQTVAAVP